MIPFALSPMTTLYMAAALFGAAWVRGYSGFGLSALVISAASLVMNPLLVVPVVLICDIALTVQQARGIRHEIDWRRTLTLFAGALIGVPLGIYFLTQISIDTARALIAAFILMMSLGLLAGFHFKQQIGDKSHVAVGFFSGIANGAGVGGLPVAVFFAALPVSAARFRATLIAYFTLLDLWSVPLLWHAGLVTRETLLACAYALPLLIAGIHFGNRAFRQAEPTNFRRFAIMLLMSLSILGLVKSMI